MCDAVVPDGAPVDVVGNSPLNVTWTCIVLAAASSTTVAKPVPGEPLAGTSFAPIRLAVSVIGTATAGSAASIMAAATVARSDKYLIEAPFCRLRGLTARLAVE